MFPRPAVVVGHRPADAGARGRRARTSAAGRRRVRGAPEVLGQVPVSCLAEEIATPGDGPDPGAGHGRRQPGAVDARRRPARRRAAGLDCMISVDNWLNETTRHAHVILPGPLGARAAALRRPDLDVRGRQRGQVLARRSSRPPTAARRSGRSSSAWPAPASGMPAGEVDVAAIDDGFFDVLRRGAAASTARRCASGYDRRRARAAARPHAPHRPVRRPLRRDARRADAREGEGRSRTASTSGRWCRALAEVLATADGKVELAPPYITADLPRLAARLDRAGRRARARQPPPPALEQLVDAQRQRCS